MLPDQRLADKSGYGRRIRIIDAPNKRIDCLLGHGGKVDVDGCVGNAHLLADHVGNDYCH